jgi:hypothetical protein
VEDPECALHAKSNGNLVEAIGLATFVEEHSAAASASGSPERTVSQTRVKY